MENDEWKMEETNKEEGGMWNARVVGVSRKSLDLSRNVIG